MSTPNWHSKLYDDELADRTINSPAFLARAEKEVEGLINLLGISPHSKILDAPCGTGRHARVFAKRQFDVTGVDINPMLLSKARENCNGMRVTFNEATMADLSLYEGKFDVVLNLSTSFGYFPTDQENAAVLRELVRCLKPGGTIVIHNIDRDWLLKVYEPVSWRETDTEFWLEARRFDPNTNYNEVNEIRLNKSTGQARRTYHRMRLYNSDEIKALMQEAGLSDIRILGGFAGEEFSRGKTSHPIYVAKMNARVII